MPVGLRPPRPLPLKLGGGGPGTWCAATAVGAEGLASFLSASKFSTWRRYLNTSRYVGDADPVMPIEDRSSLTNAWDVQALANTMYIL